MNIAPLLPLSLRSYGNDSVMHRHAHVQIVLALQGQMEIEVGGRGNCLDITRAAFVAPDIDHVQSAQGQNRFLILDCSLDDIGETTAERLQSQIFLPVSPALRRLIEFIDLSCSGAVLPEPLARHCAPLLLATLSGVQGAAKLRLGALLARIEAAPEQAWTVACMARAVNLSVSRLHALFRAELQQTPQQWLSALRLRLVREVLADSNLPLAQLAARVGYADQSALTRAMRRATGMTPAAYRRRQRQ